MPTFREPDLEDVFTGLMEMQRAILYITRRDLLAKAECVIRTQFEELNAAVLENEKLKKQLTDTLNNKFGPNNLNLKGITRQSAPLEPNHYTYSMETQPDQRSGPIQCLIGSNNNSIGSKPHHGQ